MKTLKKNDYMMKPYSIILLFAFVLLLRCSKPDNSDMDTNSNSADLIIDHRCTKLIQIPDEWIAAAKQNLHIAYGHTSHGSQLITGMTGLVSFKGSAYSWNNGGSGNALDLHDYAMSGDLGAPDRTSWADRTRTYLAANSDVNVVIWSWCGQLSTSS